MRDKADYVRRMFGAIARRYDFLNSLLSLRRDRAWRKFTVQVSGVAPTSRILDVCTGTGELALAYAECNALQSPVIGTDFCYDMLLVGKQKVEKRQTARTFTPIEADTLQLPFADNLFDIVSVGFGIRNVADVEAGIREMTRVAVRGGRVVILEFTQPNLPVFRQLYYLYFKKVLPRVGNFVSKSKDDAYGYLPNSVLAFPDCVQLTALMEKCGLRDVRFYRKTLGIVAIHVGTKG